MNLDDIYIVIVLHNCKLEDSTTFNTLSNLLNVKIQLMLYDNSPKKQFEFQDIHFKNFEIQYQHNPSNPGLAVAYNEALKQATSYKKKWLLLLDQDTLLTKEYIYELKNMIFDSYSSNIVAFIPHVVSLNNSPISPSKMFIGGICKPIKSINGLSDSAITGINSGTILRIDYVHSINGFCIDFPLDMLDHWYFRKIYKDGKSVFVMKSTIKQNLSVFNNFEKNLPFIRYQQLIRAELLFNKDDSFPSLFIYKLRLLFRLSKQLRYKNKDYYKFTLSQIV